MNEQELFWSGEFGDEYSLRNSNINLRVPHWARKLSAMDSLPTSALELGCNIGLNLHALKTILPEIDLNAVEINKFAYEKVKAWGKANIYHQSILDFVPERQYDLTFTFGVLIHINPDDLTKVYDTLYNASSRYIIISEYYNPTPVEVTYRGHKGKLFKRDFCGELLDRHKDLILRDYGFFYHRDPLCTADDTTYFVLEKQ